MVKNILNRCIVQILEEPTPSITFSVVIYLDPFNNERFSKLSILTYFAQKKSFEYLIPNTTPPDKIICSIKEKYYL